MIYLFCGDDTKNKHKGYGQFMKSMPKGTETFFIGKNDFDKVQVESLYSGSGRRAGRACRGFILESERHAFEKEFSQIF